MNHARMELIFAVRWRHILRYLGQFFLITAALNLVVFVVALCNGDFEIAPDFALVVAVFLITGVFLSRIKARGEMQLNEAMVLAAAVFLLIPLVASIPQVLYGASFLDAWFETVSAATTTGLSTRNDAASLPKTFLFARAWMQWYGGLGVVVLSLALVVRPGMSALRLAKMEAPNDLVGGTRAHARRVLLVYLTLTAVGLLGWLLSGGRPFEGLLYILSAVSTGGFAPTNNSLADLPGLRLAWIVTLTSLAGAIPLALYHQAWKKGWRTFLQNVEIRALLLFGLMTTGLLAIFLWSNGMPMAGVLRHAPLMAWSAHTTSGFSSLAPIDLDSGSKLLLILAMATGGCVGSTAGGFKLMRILILVGLFMRTIRSMSAPSTAIIEQRFGNKRIGANEVQDALMIILLFFLVVVVSWLPFLAYGYQPLDALFEVVSATATVGLSSGITQSNLPALLKLVLCADMLLGRLEFVAWMVFFYHRTWFGRKERLIMRVVFIGGGDLTVETALLLINRKQEVVIIESDRERIDELSDLLDCSFLHGDGSKPQILTDAGPEHADFLFCLTENDQYNIIAALVGRSLGYSQVVLQIYDIDYLNICRELELENTITPSKTIGRYLSDMVAGIDILELSSLIKGEARCLMIKIDKDTKGKVGDLELPDQAQVICYYRDEDFSLTTAETALQVDDEVIILTHSKHLAELTERFYPEQSEAEQTDETE